MKTTSHGKLIKVYWMNQGYYSDREFTSLVDAAQYAQQAGFEAAFHEGSGENRRWKVDSVLGSWSPVGGFRSAIR